MQTGVTQAAGRTLDQSVANVVGLVFSHEGYNYKALRFRNMLPPFLGVTLLQTGRRGIRVSISRDKWLLRMLC